MRVGEDSKVICVARAEAEPEEEDEAEAADAGSELDMTIQGEEEASAPDEEI